MASSATSRKPLIFFLVIVAIAAIGVAAYSIFDSTAKGEKDRNSQTHLNELQLEVYKLMNRAQEAKEGKQEALNVLPALKSEINDIERRFNRSEDELETPERQDLGDHVAVIDKNIDIIDAQTDNIIWLNEQLNILQETIPQVQQAYTTVVDTMLRTGVPSDQVAEAQAQVWRAERLLTSLNSILAGSTEDPTAAAEQFRQDVLVFNQVLIGMKEGNLILGISRVESPDARLLLEQVETQFLSLNESIQSFIDASPALAEVNEAGDNIINASQSLLQTTGTLNTQINGLAGDFEKRKFSGRTTIGAAIAMVVALAFLGLLSYRNTRTSLKVTEETNEANQEAILRLLDEIADLGEGDLTVKATVTEDFTGAIADSINYAVEQLRALVSDVANTAESVSASSNETRATSLRLSDASEHQARQVAEASTSINEISTNLSKVSEDAEELANVAQSSVTVARNGAEVVQNTIDGMNNIREQIQDTSKRIKRLGESSQEIGDIVSLINEIADQTNILALNASIQAAMAGEAGRGFAVVADEVQGLAERAAFSTKQIETLVKTIQSDTNEAVASMEQTTAEVVRGAQLANDAGTALNEIQSTSENLAKLILAIATETQDQSANANRIVGTMTVIQDISSETLAGTTESARAVGELAEQAQTLRDSIADFKLPDGTEEASDEEILGMSDDDSDVDDLIDSDMENDLEEPANDNDGEASADFDADLEDITAEAEEVEQLLDDESENAQDETDTLDNEENILGSDEDQDHDSDESIAAGFGGDEESEDDATEIADFSASSEEDEASSDDSEFDTEFMDDLSDEEESQEDNEVVDVSDDESDDEFDDSVFADLDLEDDSDDEEETAESTASVEGVVDQNEDESEEEDFSFSDEDFLTFDLDEEDEQKA